MNYDLTYLVNYITKYMTINAGDIILLGSSERKIYLKENDEVALRLKCGGETVAEVLAHTVPGKVSFKSEQKSDSLSPTSVS